MVVSFHCEETSLYRRHYHWCGTVLHRKTWLPPTPPHPLPKTHVSSTSITLALAHQTAVRSTDRKLQRLHASSLPRNPRCTTGPPSETHCKQTAVQDVDSCREQNLTSSSSATRGNTDTSVKLCWRVFMMYGKCCTRAGQVHALVCLTVWRHCAMCTLHGIPLPYHSHAIVRWAWMGWDYHCLGSVT